MLSVIMLNVVMLIGIMLSVVLSVVAPSLMCYVTQDLCYKNLQS
jgi:hypothetical protein